MLADIIIVSVAVVVFAAVFLLFFFLYVSLMRRIARRKHRRVSTLIGVGFCAFIGISVGGLLLTLEVPTFWEAGFLVVTAGMLGMPLLAAGLSVASPLSWCDRPSIFRRAEESRPVSPTHCCRLDGRDSCADYCVCNTCRFRSGVQNYWPDN